MRMVKRSMEDVLLEDGTVIATGNLWDSCMSACQMLRLLAKDPEAAISRSFL